MVEFLGAVILAASAFYGGYRFQVRRTINYKKRWIEANDLIKELRSTETDRAVLALDQALDTTSSKPKAAGPPDYHRLTPWDRVEQEEERLDAGLPPLDDLQMLNPIHSADILRARTEAGWFVQGDSYVKVVKAEPS